MLPRHPGHVEIIDVITMPLSILYSTAVALSIVKSVAPMIRKS